MNNQQKIVVSSLALLLLAFLPGGVSAATNNNANTDTSDPLILQGQIINSLDTALARLNTNIGKVQGIPNLDIVIKNQTLSQWQKVKTDLSQYKENVQKAENIAELPALSQSVQTYLSDHKNIFQNAFVSIRLSLGNQVVNILQDYQEKLAALLPQLKDGCAKKKYTFGDLEDLSDEVTQITTDLKQSLASNPDSRVVTQTAKANETIQKMGKLLGEIEEECL